MSDLLRDSRTVELLALLWNAPDKAIGLPIVDLPERLHDQGLFTEWLDSDLIEVLRRNYSTIGGQPHIEKGWCVADLRARYRKRPWEMLHEALTENVANDLRHRIRLGKTGEVEAARLAREAGWTRIIDIALAERQPADKPTDLRVTPVITESFSCPKCGAPLPESEVTFDENGQPELRWCHECRAEAQKRQIVWKQFPFKDYSFSVVVRTSWELARIPASVAIPSYTPTDAEVALFRRVFPDMDASSPRWEEIRGILLVHGVSINEDTSIGMLLGILRAIEQRGRSTMDASIDNAAQPATAEREAASSAFSLLDRFPATQAGHVAFLESVRDEVRHAAEAKRGQGYSNATIESMVSGCRDRWSEANARLAALSGLPEGVRGELGDVLQRELTAGTVEQIDALLKPAVNVVRDSLEHARRTDLVSNMVVAQTAGDLWKAYAEGKQPCFQSSGITLRPGGNIASVTCTDEAAEVKRTALDRAVALVTAEGGDKAAAMEKLIARVQLQAELDKASVINMPLAEFVAAAMGRTSAAGSAPQRKRARVGRTVAAEDFAARKAVTERWDEFGRIYKGLGYSRCSYEFFAQWATEHFDDMPSDDPEELRRMIEAHSKTPRPKNLRANTGKN